MNIEITEKVMKQLGDNIYVCIERNIPGGGARIHLEPAMAESMGKKMDIEKVRDILTTVMCRVASSAIDNDKVDTGEVMDLLGKAFDEFPPPEKIRIETLEHKPTIIAGLEAQILFLKQTLKSTERANHHHIELRREEKEEYNKKLMELAGLHPGDKVLLGLFEGAKEDIARLQLKTAWFEKRLDMLENSHSSSDTQIELSKRNIAANCEGLKALENKIEQIRNKNED